MEVKGMTKVLRSLVVVCLISVHVYAEDKKQPTASRDLLILTSLTYASALYDVHTTLSVLSRCHGDCYEGNRLMRPFVRNTASAYAFTMGMSSAATVGTYQLKKKNVRLWWVPMAAATALHLAAGMHNQRLSESLHEVR